MSGTWNIETTGITDAGKCFQKMRWEPRIGRRVSRNSVKNIILSIICPLLQTRERPLLKNHHVRI